MQYEFGLVLKFICNHLGMNRLRGVMFIALSWRSMWWSKNCSHGTNIFWLLLTAHILDEILDILDKRSLGPLWMLSCRNPVFCTNLKQRYNKTKITRNLAPLLRPWSTFVHEHMTVQDVWYWSDVWWHVLLHVHNVHTVSSLKMMSKSVCPHNN